MHSRFFFLIIVIILVACSGASESPPTEQSEPTIPPDPTSTPTELIETEVPPTPAPTDTPPPTPTQAPTETPIPIQFNFTWYENNPILEKGTSDEWDFWNLVEGKVVLIDDIFHMFYTGIAEESLAIGYAVSSDGFEFTKHDTNPIFQSDGEGFDAIGVVTGTPLLVDDNWMLFYGAVGAGERFYFNFKSGSSIGLSTAPEPIGPWTTGQQVLTAGGIGEWDSGFIWPSSVIVTDEGYRLYYTAGIDPGFAGIDPGLGEMMCGLATSSDGINWTKYDDPSTTDPPFADSDPVIQTSSSGWDRRGIDCNVIYTDTGWEMFYEGWSSYDRIGYASSPDGVHWTKFEGNPEIGNNRFFPSAIKVGSTYYLYAQDYGSKGLDVATGTIDQP